MIVNLLRPNPNKHQVDSYKKSVLKTISWRIIGTLDTMIISYFLTANLSVAISIGGIEVVSKMLLYYLHERVWNNVSK